METNQQPFRYAYLPEHLPYMHKQIWECKDDIAVYSQLSEFEFLQYVNYLPVSFLTPKHHNVLDLGCGLGRVACYLYHQYSKSNLSFILADQTGDCENSTGEYGKDEVYNDLSLTASFCKLNNLPRFTIWNTQLNDLLDIPKIGNDSEIDLVISCCAFGMHFPIAQILNDLIAISNPNVTMIFGTRNRAHYGYSSWTRNLKNYFQEVYFSEQEQVSLGTPDAKRTFPQQDWLILKGLK